jgi:hypothetical protein
MIDTQIIIKANEYHIEYNLILHNASDNSRIDEYSNNKVIYKYSRINQLHSLYNQHTYIIYITCILKIISFI